MPWQQAEFILKGIFLGLLLFIAMREPTGRDVAIVGAWTVGTFVLCLGIAAVRKLREGYRVRGRLPAFLLFLLLENPGLVYAGVLLGMMLGAFTIEPPTQAANFSPLYAVLGGAILGYIFLQLRQVKGPRRMWLSLALVTALVGGTIALLWTQPTLLDAQAQRMFGILLLAGIPFFYLLTFASLVEESEIEIAAICASLGIGLWILGAQVSMLFQNLALAVPLVLYFTYTRRVLPGLRVFKHVLRGISYANVGQDRWAMISLSRALQLDPGNKLAYEQLWQVHRQMDFHKIANDPETLAVVNFELCLDRAGALLLAAPTPEQRAEALRVLDFVAQQRPAMTPRCDYWRAVAALHEKQYDDAARLLEGVLLPSDDAERGKQRRKILLTAWQLALLLHPEMNRRVATLLLERPGCRMEAIDAVERRLAEQPEDVTAWDLKRLLYAGLCEKDYTTVVPPEEVAPHFDHAYVEQLGQALLGDPQRWERGIEYLRVAAHGHPTTAPLLYVQIAKTCEKAGKLDESWQHYELAKQIGHRVGPKTLTDEARQAYFGVVKMLAEAAREQGDIPQAIENYHLYCDYERAGMETYRALADLYDRKGDAWAALQCTELGLVYDSSDKDLLARKDKYYYSVQPAELEHRKELVRKWFDVEYCTRKARALLDKQGSDLDIVDWASHLLDLAQVLNPAGVAIKVQRARVRRLRGDVADAIVLLEEVRGGKPEKFASTDEEEAWFLACRLLGDLYLNEHPDKAVQCLQEFRKSARSGADTDYKLGVAYEHLGDRARAVKCYKLVLAFENHPLSADAREALSRLEMAAR